jgi:hypothetical protein
MRAGGELAGSANAAENPTVDQTAATDRAMIAYRTADASLEKNQM